MTAGRRFASTLADTFPHGLVRDERGGVTCLWVAHPAGRHGLAGLEVLGIARTGRHLVIHRARSGEGHAAALAAVDACLTGPVPGSGGHAYPVAPCDDVRPVIDLMVATLEGNDDRDWFVPRLDDVAEQLRRPGTEATEVEAASAAGTWVAAIHRDVRAFLASLDPEAVHLARRPRVRPAFPNQAWGTFDRTFAGGAPLAMALSWMPDLPVTLGRIQRDDPVALSACGCRADLAGLVLRHLRADGCIADSMSGALAGALDAMAGLPDGEAVAIRAAIGMGSPGDKLVAAVDLLRELPRNWAPRDAGEWRAYLGNGHHVLCKAASLTLCRASYARLVGAGRGWRDLERRVAAAGGGPASPAETRARLDGVDDVVRSFAHQVAAPCMAAARGLGPARALPREVARSAVHAAGRILLSGRSLPRLLEWSTRWHRRQAGIQAMLEALPREGEWKTGWDPAFPDAEVDGFSISVLLDAAALAAEGEALGHCVGGYSPECRSGTSRILSVCRGGAKLSTAELRMSGDAVALAQHRGPGNADPTPAETAAVASYLEGIHSGALAWDPAGLEPVPENDGHALAHDAGYEWWRPGHVEAALEAWRPFLPRAARSLDAAAWAEALRRASAGPGWEPASFGTPGWPTA